MGFPPLAQPKPRAKAAAAIEVGGDVSAPKIRARRAGSAPRPQYQMIWGPEYAAPGGRHSWELTEAREREGQDPFPIRWACRVCGMVKKRGFGNDVEYIIGTDHVAYAWRGRVPKCSPDLLRVMGERFGDARVPDV